MVTIAARARALLAEATETASSRGYASVERRATAELLKLA
jgi:hypothetical protein